MYLIIIYLVLFFLFDFFFHINNFTNFLDPPGNHSSNLYTVLMKIENSNNSNIITNTTEVLSLLMVEKGGIEDRNFRLFSTNKQGECQGFICLSQNHYYSFFISGGDGSVKYSIIIQRKDTQLFANNKYVYVRISSSFTLPIFGLFEKKIDFFSTNKQGFICLSQIHLFAKQ